MCSMNIVHDWKNIMYYIYSNGMEYKYENLI